MAKAQKVLLPPGRDSAWGRDLRALIRKDLDLPVPDPRAPDAWSGSGGAATLCRWQFQVLYREFASFKLASKYAEDLVLWPAERRPDAALMHSWANEFDRGEHNIDPKVDTNMQKRIENYVRAKGIDHIITVSSTAKEIARLARETVASARNGEIDDKKVEMLAKLSPVFQHANNAVGWVGEKLGVSTRKDATVTNNIGRMFVNTPPQPKVLPKRKVAHKRIKIPDAEWREAD